MDIKTMQGKLTTFLGKYKYVLLVLAVGIILMLIPSQREEKTQQETEKPQLQQTDISDRLSEILMKIDGAGKVEVMLTLSQGEQTLYQQNESVSGGESENYDRDTVIITDENRGQSGLIQQVNPPKYQGAIIVCQGADRAGVRLSIIEAVSKVTGLGTDRISVLKMK